MRLLHLRDGHRRPPRCLLAIIRTQATPRSPRPWIGTSAGVVANRAWCARSGGPPERSRDRGTRPARVSGAQRRAHRCVHGTGVVRPRARAEFAVGCGDRLLAAHRRRRRRHRKVRQGRDRDRDRDRGRTDRGRRTRRRRSDDHRHRCRHRRYARIKRVTAGSASTFRWCDPHPQSGGRSTRGDPRSGQLSTASPSPANVSRRTTASCRYVARRRCAWPTVRSSAAVSSSARSARNPRR